MVEVPTDQGKPKKKAYSIASSPDETGTLDFCIKLVEGGLATNWFWSLQEGDRVTLGGAYGNFVLPEPASHDLIFVATGTGLAPFRSMIHYLLKRGFKQQLTLIFGVRYEDEILYDKEWREFAARHENFRYIPTISRPKNWEGETGYVQEQLKKYVSDPKGKALYACGLVPMIAAVEKTALEIGFDKKQIHYEKYV